VLQRPHVDARLPEVDEKVGEPVALRDIDVGAREQDVLDALRALRLDSLSPIEALNKLDKLKRRLEE